MNDYTQESHADIDALHVEYYCALRRFNRWVLLHEWGYRTIRAAGWINVPLFVAGMLLIFTGSAGVWWVIGPLYINAGISSALFLGMRFARPKLVAQVERIEALTVKIRERHRHDPITPASPPP